MSELLGVVEMDDDDEKPARFKSFAEEVWHTLQLIDVTEYVSTKGKFDYLPWANAWVRVMGCFPESEFEFDEPKFYPNGTGEQWVTVKIKRGQDCVERRWWLPYLSYTNQPVTDPSAMQINTTRMRVLVKCLAMCGLGTEIYSGEDLPDKDTDQEAVAGVRAPDNTLTPEQIYEGRGHIDTINRALPLDAIKTTAAGNISGYDLDRILYDQIDTMLGELDGKADLKLWVLSNVDKLQNRALRNYEKKKAKERESEVIRD